MSKRQEAILRALVIVFALSAPPAVQVARAEDLYLQASTEAAMQTALATMGLYSTPSTDQNGNPTGGYITGGVGFALTFLPSGAWNVPLVKKTASTWTAPACAEGCVAPQPMTVYVAPAAVGSPEQTTIDPRDTDYTQQTTTVSVNGQQVSVPAMTAVPGFTALLRWNLDPSLITSAVSALQITTPDNPPIVFE